MAATPLHIVTAPKMHCQRVTASLSLPSTRQATKEGGLGRVAETPSAHLLGGTTMLYGCRNPQSAIKSSLLRQTSHWMAIQ